MDRETLAYYEKNADAWASRAVGGSGFEAFFERAFPAGGRVLDVGCGPGRLLAALLARGFAAWGVEPVRALREWGERNRPAIAGRVLPGGLPDALPDVAALGGPMDGVLCSASLQHLPLAALRPSLRELLARMTGEGSILLSVPRERPGLDAGHRDGQGRLFTPLPEPFLRAELEAVGLEVAEVADHPDPRPGHAWTVMIARRVRAER